jgi:LuxR family maltose regulon positive regulatory protein
MLGAPSPLSTQNLIRALLNEIAESNKPFVLILDDYHVISSSEVQSAVLQLIQGMPANMAAIISSRQEPKLPTLKLSARGELVELGPADLSFTDVETAEFLRELQELDLSATEISDVARWADGWPVALRLISRIMRGRTRPQIESLLESLPEAVPTIDDYLWDEVLSTRPTEQREFLIHTSILAEFNPELAAAVSRNPMTAELLQSLVRDNLFITRLDGPGNWHRYHPLFAEVLGRRFQRDIPEELQLEVHTRAAEWYETNDRVSEAARHALLARNWSKAARHLVGICGESFDQERIGSLRTWLRDLPPEVFERAPELAYWMAWAEFRSGHRRGASQLVGLVRDTTAPSTDLNVALPALQVALLEQVIDQDACHGQADARKLLEMTGPEPTTARSRTLTMIAILQRLGGDLESAEKTLEEVRSINGRIGSRGLQELEQNATADLLLAMGKLKEPAELLRRNIAQGDEWNDLAVQSAYLKLGWICLELNQLDEAQTTARHGAEIATKTNTPIYLPPAHALRSCIALAQRDWDRALDEIERASASAAASEAFGQIRRYEEMKCRIWLATDHLSLAQGWLQQVGPEVLESTRFQDLQTVMTAIRVRIHEGRSQEVIASLDRLCDLSRKSRWKRALLEIQVLRAVAEIENENVATAQCAIDDALVLGAAEGFTRIYLDEGQRIRPALKLAARQDGPKREYAVALLAGTGETVLANRALGANTPSMLSARERDVMRLVAIGLSNRAVGDTLFISEETVKTHLRRIFDKLGVSSRTQAISRSKELQLL